MRVYTVHIPPGGGAENAVLVKEGFSWPALLFGPIWALYRRLWLGTAVWIAVLSLLAAAQRFWPGAGSIMGLAWIAFAVLFAAEGNELSRRALARRGFSEAGVVGGQGRDAAQRRFADLTAIGRA